MEGKVVVTASDTTFMGTSVVKIMSIGIMNYNKSSERRDTSIAYVRKTVINPMPVKALIQTNALVSTAGGVVMDGRDHAAPPPNPPTLIDTQGTYGVWTTNTFTMGGGSSIGGTAGGTDYLPSSSEKKAAPIIKQGQTWPGGYPNTPDSAAGGTANGYPEGTLKSVAQSGANGSQYVTDPLTLKYPLSGITYVELPLGVQWSPALVYGSGILVVHNSTTTAALKNIGGDNKGNDTFTGIIIADDIVHIQGNLIGGLIELTSSPSEGKVIGNSNGNIWYSKQAVLNATNSLNVTGGNGSAANVIGWWE
jgi:hypothetical protein